MADTPRFFFVRDIASHARLKRFSALLLGSYLGLVAGAREATPIEIGVGADATFCFVVLVEQIGIDVGAAKSLVRFLDVLLVVRAI